MRLTLTLIRGLPGSGKSTLARSMGIPHYEADMYFIDNQGCYHFHPDKLEQAHHWCRQQTQQSLARGESVVVANTFARRWEIAPYAKLAKRFGAQLDVIECHEQYPNIHGVSDKTIQSMKKRWQSWPNARQS